jgi:hypothetical protein
LVRAHPGRKNLQRLQDQLVLCLKALRLRRLLLK